MGEPNPEGREGTRHVHLNDLLVQATFSPNRSIPDGIKSIDLGEVGTVSEGLIDRSLASPTAQERGRSVVITGDRRLLITENDDVGNDTNLAPSHRLRKSPIPSENEYGALYAHSHSVYELPISSYDVAPLFLGREDAHSLTSVLAITTLRKSIVFRGPRTPFWDRQKAYKVRDKWKYELSQKTKRRLKEGMTLEQQEGVNALVQQQFIRFLNHEFDLRFYSCRSEENIAYEDTV